MEYSTMNSFVLMREMWSLGLPLTKIFRPNFKIFYILIYHIIHKCGTIVEQLKNYILYNRLSGMVKLESNGIVADVDQSWWNHQLQFYCKLSDGDLFDKILIDIHSYTGAKYIDIGGGNDSWLYPWDESRQIYFGQADRKEIGLE